MSKIRILIKNNPIKISFLLVFIGFFYFKIINLDSYNFYPGKIIGLENIKKNVNTVGKSSSSIIISREIPKVEYYKGYDTIRYDQGELRLFTNFDVNDSVIILENKSNNNKTFIYSLFYYWIDYYEIVFVGLVFMIILGSIKNFF